MASPSRSSLVVPWGRENAARDVDLSRDVPPSRGGRDRWVRQILGAADLATVFASFFAAYVIRDRWLEAWVGPLFALDEYVWLLWVILPTWILLSIAYGLYDPVVYGSRWRLLGSLTKVQLTGALVLTSAMFVSKSAEISRLLIQVFLVTSFVALFVEKTAIGIALPKLGRRQNAKRDGILIVGARPLAETIWNLVDDHRFWGARVIGFVSTDSDSSEATTAPILGTVEDLPAILDRQAVDEIVVAPGPGDDVDVGALAEMCVERGVTFRAVLQWPEIGAGRTRVEELGGGRYLLSFEMRPPGSLALAAKRAIDVVGAIVGLAICGVVALWYAPRLRRESPGPLFFRQRRIGRSGREFVLYKFRTMTPDAEERLESLLDRNEMEGFLFKMRDDPRVLAVGREMRRAHLDELPQFWNVLKGEMSLVGTRPPTRGEVERYRPHHRRRLSMKPGITGPWQIRGNESISDFEEVVRLDCEYIDQWSLRRDFVILLKTVAKVRSRRGW